MNLNQIKLAELKKKRDYIFLAESTYPQLRKLHKQREEFDKNIQKIHQEISERFYSDCSGNFDHFNESKEKLKKLNQEIKKIDSVIDEWDNLEDENLELLRENLFLQIWEQFPEQFNDQKTIWNELKFLGFVEKKINPVQNFLEELIPVLERVRETRIKMKGKGILSYIFGTSPNAIIEKHLLFAHDLIVNNHELLNQAAQHIQENSQFKIFQKIYDSTAELKDDCKKIWGFRHIDTTIKNHEKSVLDLFHQLKNLSEENKEKSKILKKELDQWLKLEFENQILA